MGVRDFLKSDDFMADLAILNTPVLQHGYAEVLNEVQVLELLAFDIGKFSNYNHKIVEQVDRLMIPKGASLPTWLSILLCP